jgi:hypothetical protein
MRFCEEEIIVWRMVQKVQKFLEELVSFFANISVKVHLLKYFEWEPTQIFAYVKQRGKKTCKTSYERSAMLSGYKKFCSNFCIF